MKVVYEQGLAPLAAALHTMGFEMHPMGAEVLADAVLFTASSGAAMRQKPGQGGALVLNVRGLSAAETAEALKRRVHGALL